jgi:hypothetical protein
MMYPMESLTIAVDIWHSRIRRCVLRRSAVIQPVLQGTCRIASSIHADGPDEVDAEKLLDVLMVTGDRGIPSPAARTS